LQQLEVLARKIDSRQRCPTRNLVNESGAEDRRSV
jgi:hypothetical protein